MMILNRNKTQGFSAKIVGGGFKNDEKTKKKLQNDKEKWEKRKKRRKIEKNAAKRCTLGGVFSKSENFLVLGADSILRR